MLPTDSSTFATLMAISPLDGRYAEKLSALRVIASEYGLMRYRVRVEIQWLLALATQGLVYNLETLSATQQSLIEDIATHFTPNDADRIKQIEQTTRHDVKAVEYFIRDKIQDIGGLDALLPYIHFACTSEDINNLAYALMLQQIRAELILPALQYLLKHLKNKADEYAGLAMLARTHGQPATPTTLGKEFANVVARLQRQIQQLEAIEILGKYNGAVGNYNAHQAAFPEVDWADFNEQFVKRLGLVFNPYTTQIEPHDYIAEYLQNVTRINTVLLDLSRDVWSYISLGYFNQKCAENEVGSSTMPHKINPIDFENAEGNLGVANALNEHMALKLPLSRWQRDLSDSTVLRNLGVTIGYSLLAYAALDQGLSKIDANHALITHELHNHTEVLAEAIQTIMRRYGINDAYEKLKTLTRGKKMTTTTLTEWVDQQTHLPEAAKIAILALRPESYLGYAILLASKTGKVD